MKKKKEWPIVYLYGVEKRGRDIAPFLLYLLPAALEINHIAFVKLHTKQSPHLKDGQDWCHHLVNGLVDPKLLLTIKIKIENDPERGLIARSGTLVNTSVALSKNVDHLERLLRKIQWERSWALNQSYIAGRMMAGRLSIIKSLDRLGLTIENFEIEQGQTDGTLAHALERLISRQYLSQNLIIKEISSTSTFVPRSGYG